MNKSIMMLISLMLVGCSSDSDKLQDQVNKLRERNDELSQQLSSCQTNYESLKAQNTYIPEVEEPEPEPTCEEWTVWSIYREGKYIASCEEVGETACGIYGKGCTDGAEYNCLTNVKAVSETKRKCN